MIKNNIIIKNNKRKKGYFDHKKNCMNPLKSMTKMVE